MGSGFFSGGSQGQVVDNQGFYDGPSVTPITQPSAGSPGGSGFFDGPQGSTLDSKGFYDGPSLEQLDPVIVGAFRDEAVAAAAASKASETAAASSAIAASNSSDSAHAHEMNAATSASSAAGSATAASTSAGNAATSEFNAASSASTAATQAGIATTQAGIATTKAGDASTSAGNAATSASNAATSATNASNSATAANTSAGNAAGSASAAATSASNAASAASTAATNAVAAAQGTVTPAVDGTASVGSSTKWAREDHVHPFPWTLGQLPGVLGASTVAAGRVGERLISSGSANLSSNVWANCGSLTLTPGVWDVEGYVSFGGPGATGSNNWGICVGPNPASTSGAVWNSATRSNGGSLTGDSSPWYHTPRSRVTVGANTPYYVNGVAQTNGAYSCTGYIIATRVA
ncbi:hypothetical protein JQ617_08045 [Bradyrhizobium sp. KB893862 SZCCT0404]|uniref:hypothetical protein n=1 Tax=Bradyrhizobium sp. KB893862 SZCCT0404 TaxID=2807672 RepID=UPI001BA7EC7B|nr:hypothetical protein [Bradyrhizobium sp. KB893862 SZCCT0404]MBR1173901.1 hypothetical protein [Bradyrhizobium sp. KB893862 SZCCT0404]